MLGGICKSGGRVDFDSDVSKTRMHRWMRVVSGLLLLVVAAVHLNLYAGEDYDRIPIVGWLFLLTAVSGVLLGAALLFLRPRRESEALAGLFALGVLGGYVLTLVLPDGLFSFKEPGVSYSGFISIAAESVIVLLSVLTLSLGSRGSNHPGSIVVAG